MPAGLLGALAIMVPFFLGWQVVRVWRHRLTRQQVTAIHVSGLLVYASVLATWSASARGEGRLFVIPLALAWSLVVLGVTAQALASWSKRSRWR